jgi:hypothetical protein
MSATQHRAVHERLVRWADSTTPTPSPELSGLLGTVPPRQVAAASGRVVALRPVTRAGIGVKVMAVVLGLGVVSAAAVGVTRTALRPPVIPDPVVVPAAWPSTFPDGRGTPGPAASPAPSLSQAGPTAAAPAPTPARRAAGPAGAAVPKPRHGIGTRPAVAPSPTGPDSTEPPSPQTDDGAGRDPSTGAVVPTTNDADPGSPTSEPTAVPTG